MGGQQGNPATAKNIEEKRQRIAANKALAEYYRAKVTNNGSGDAQGLLEKLKDIFEQTADKGVAPPAPLTQGKQNAT